MKPFLTPTFNGTNFDICTLMFDRDGNLWVGTVGKGLLRIRGNAVEHYDHTNGFPAIPYGLYLKTGKEFVWAGTTSGIDSFRDPRVTTFSPLEGLAKDLPAGVLASRDGTVWVANDGSLDQDY